MYSVVSTSLFYISFIIPGCKIQFYRWRMEIEVNYLSQSKTTSKWCNGHLTQICLAPSNCWLQIKTSQETKLKRRLFVRCCYKQGYGLPFLGDTALSLFGVAPSGTLIHLFASLTIWHYLGDMLFLPFYHKWLCDGVAGTKNRRLITGQVL